jgi:hypothetical protein
MRKVLIEFGERIVKNLLQGAVKLSNVVEQEIIEKIRKALQEEERLKTFLTDLLSHPEECPPVIKGFILDPIDDLIRLHPVIKREGGVEAKTFRKLEEEARDKLRKILGSKFPEMKLDVTTLHFDPDEFSTIKFPKRDEWAIYRK